MSDFLIVIPAGWLQMDWAAISAANPDMNVTNVTNWIETEQFSYIADALKAQELIPADAVVIGARLFDGAYFAVLLG